MLQYCMVQHRRNKGTKTTLKMTFLVRGVKFDPLGGERVNRLAIPSSKSTMGKSEHYIKCGENLK